MEIQQLYTGCLSEAAYFIASDGEAAIIDPLRDVDTYIQMAQEKGVKIKYIFETHFHADFVSGHLDLAKKTGATIVFGPTAKPAYEAHIAEDGEALADSDDAGGKAKSVHVSSTLVSSSGDVKQLCCAHGKTS